MFYVYLIKSSEGFHYTGQTENIQKRLSEHNAGISHVTKHGSNWKVIHLEIFSSRKEAMQREKWFKSGVGREWIKNNVTEWDK